MTAHDRLIKGYVNLVKSGRLTLDQVPEKYRAEVEENLYKWFYINN